MDSNGILTSTSRIQVSYLEEQVFKEEINTFVKSKEILAENIQKAYSLVLGQCTEIMVNKLKMSLSWEKIKVDQNVIQLLLEIKNIIYKFDDQKYQVLSIHKAKSSFYAFRQGELTNAQYLQKFRNLTDISTSFGGNMHDSELSYLVSKDFLVWIIIWIHL